MRSLDHELHLTANGRSAKNKQRERAKPLVFCKVAFRANIYLEKKIVKHLNSFWTPSFTQRDPYREPQVYPLNTRNCLSTIMYWKSVNPGV
jgi:hypothetical protein